MHWHIQVARDLHVVGDFEANPVLSEPCFIMAGGGQISDIVVGNSRIGAVEVIGNRVQATGVAVLILVDEEGGGEVAAVGGNIAGSGGHGGEL